MSHRSSVSPANAVYPANSRLPAPAHAVARHSQTPDGMPSVPPTNLPITRHALERMRARSIGTDAVTAALFHGRSVHVRGAEIYAIGRVEVRDQSIVGPDISAFEGVQVVCSPAGDVLTVYRNHDFRDLRRRRRPHRRRGHQAGRQEVAR